MLFILCQNDMLRVRAYYNRNANEVGYLHTTIEL